MNTRITLAASAAILFAGEALAVTPPVRVRGTISAVDGNTLKVAEAGGQTDSIQLTDQTKYAGVVKSSLDDLHKGDFIGTATKGPKSFMVALELVIFPDSMRGTGEGQYPWDRISDTTGRGASGGSMSSMAATSTMTNGSVSSTQSSGGARSTNSTMTNGTVSAAGHGATKTITVTYNGQSQKVIVPPTAPIVAFRPGDKSLAVAGSKVFVVATGAPGQMSARFVAVGQDGVTPPM